MASDRSGPLICLALTAPTIERDLSIVGEYGKYADLVELRVDCLDRDERAHAGRLPALAGLPAVLTIRRSADGGRFEETEADRIALLKGLISAGFAYVDLEEDLLAPGLDAAAAAAGVRVIRSLHDPNGVPDDLGQRFRRLARNPREIPKAAVTPRGSADLSRLLETASSAARRGAARQRIILGMGEAGFCTRLLAGRIGSWLSYASAPGMWAAPGHTDPRTLSGMYRFHSISPDTAVYGVIGNPVSHSLSPLIHNRGLAALGLDAVYLPFLVDDPEAFLPAARRLGVRGLSVTIPHKQTVLPLLAKRDDLVEAAGACNTMWRVDSRRGGPPRSGLAAAIHGRFRHGEWAGTNTDIEGFLAPLKALFGGRIPSPLSAVVLGAGGAARGVIAALSSVGARVLVLNRTVEKAHALADAHGTEWGPLDESGAGRAEGAELVVNTTRVGMGSSVDSDPLPALRLSGRETVYDLAYGDRQTALVRRARDAGCRTISGQRMLLAQACLQFRIFTGRDYPASVRDELESQAEAGELSGA